MKLNTTQFKGIAPQIAPQLLSEGQAQTAHNCKLFSGELRPWRNAALDTPISQVGLQRTIHLYQDQYWLSWDADVDVVISQVSQDDEARFYFTGTADGPRKSNLTLATSGGSFYPMESYPLGVPAPTTALTATPGTGGDAPTRDVIWTVTFVTGWGEESAPGPASSSIALLTGQTADLTNIPVGPAGYNITARRIYRGNAGTTDAAFQFLTEISDNTTTTYSDTTPDDELGAAISTTTWTTPPDTLRGLVVLPNGVYCGFVGKDIYLSEAGYPYAWPIANILTIDANIVGLAIYSNQLVIMTDTYPFVTTGSDPQYMDQPVKISDPQPCVSKRSIASSPVGVCYASPDGLYMVQGSTGALITAGKMKRSDWQAFHPETMQGVVHDGQYYGFYNSGTEAGCVVISLNRDSDGNFTGEIATLDLTTSAAHTWLKDDALYYVDQTATFGFGLTTFTGSGLNDMTFAGSYTASNAATFDVEIDGLSPDTFKWRKNSGTYTTGVGITGSYQSLSDGVTVRFGSTTGHTVGNSWSMNVDLGNEIWKWEGDQTQSYGRAIWRGKDYLLPFQTNLQTARVVGEYGTTQDEYTEGMAGRLAVISRNAAKISAAAVGGELGTYPFGEIILGDNLEDVPAATPYAGDEHVYFRLYGDDALVYEREVFDSKPFRLPGGIRYRKFSTEVESNVTIKQIDIGTSVSEIKG